jgi:glycosyltransferase involved in cell wall biosynthesis
MVVHGPYPLGEERASREARAALEAGWDVDVVAMQQPGEPMREIVEGVRVLRLPVRHGWGGGAGRVALEYLGFTVVASVAVGALAAKRRYAAVHVHNPPDFLVVTALLPKLLGCRLVLDIHDLAPEMFALRFDGRRGADQIVRALRWVERWAAGVADAVVTVHEPYRRELEERGVRPEKTVVVLNSVDESLLPQVPPPSGGSDFRVVYHGTVTPHYGIELLVDAVARSRGDVPEIRLEIYGDGDALPAVEERAIRLGIADRVRTTRGWLPQREVLERVAGASVGIVANLGISRNQSAVPTKLFEYVALGIPVISSDLRAVAEHFSPSEVAFFRAGDSADLARALVAAAREPDAAAARAGAARRRYDEYRWGPQAQRYVALLERLRHAKVPRKYGPDRGDR